MKTQGTTNVIADSLHNIQALSYISYGVKSNNTAKLQLG